MLRGRAGVAWHWLGRRRGARYALLLGVLGVGAAWRHAPAPAPAAGVFALTKAAGNPPPVPFALEVMGGSITGTVNGARVTLADDGSYTSDVVVQWKSTLPIPVPGIQNGKEPQAIRGTGRYTSTDSSITFEPDDFLSRRFIRTVTAKRGEKTLTLVGASGGLAGSHVDINAEFVRVR
jgi:hypothetical protein